jgi:thioredoxin-dependent peroxiredoxin
MSCDLNILKVNEVAPDFSLRSDTGEVYSLVGCKGKFVILYFYPKDNTSGCTAQACQFRDLEPLLQQKNVIVLGVSRDSLKSHHKFRENHQLNFPLLSDEDGEVCQKYGVWVEKSMYGRKYFGIERSTFLIAPDGKIQYIWRKVKVPDHGMAVLNQLSQA